MKPCPLSLYRSDEPCVCPMFITLCLQCKKRLSLYHGNSRFGFFQLTKIDHFLPEGVGLFGELHPDVTQYSKYKTPGFIKSLFVITIYLINDVIFLLL